jgi:hypothetical protein
MIFDYIFPGTVAGAAKIDRIYPVQPEWIENQP